MLSKLYTFSQFASKVWEKVGDERDHDGGDAQADGELVEPWRHGAEEGRVKRQACPEPRPQLPVHIPKVMKETTMYTEIMTKTWNTVIKHILEIS